MIFTTSNKNTKWLYTSRILWRNTTSWSLSIRLLLFGFRAGWTRGTWKIQWTFYKRELDRASKKSSVS